jgi:MFS family permease
MQRIVQVWLVLTLTHSGTVLGLLATAQFAPTMLLAAYAGAVVDRVDKRRQIRITQTIQGLLALTLGVVTLAGLVEVWIVFVVAFALGTANAFESPTRHTLLNEVAGPEDLGNAVTLNSLMVNLSRVVGPAIGGALLALVGPGPCFMINAATSLASLLAVTLMDPAAMHPARGVARARGQVRQGLRYVMETPGLRTPLLVMAAIGALGYEFPVVLPLLASETFHAGAGTYGTMIGVIGVGAVGGGLVVARREQVDPAALMAATIVFGAVMLLTAAAPTLAIAYAALLAVGAAMLASVALAQTLLQLSAAPDMRGRVMSFWTLAWAGTTPIGGPIVGWISQVAGPRWGLALGGVTAIVAGFAGTAAMQRARTPAPTGA